MANGGSRCSMTMLSVNHAWGERGMGDCNS